MKVKIGPYKNYIGPYEIARGLLFFLNKNNVVVEKFGDFLAGTDHREYNLLTRFCSWLASKRKRTVKVKLHPSDTWNADETLAHIILPMLRQLKADKYSSAPVDNDDVPEHLHRPPGVDIWDIDEHWHERWSWALDEMIFAFERKVDSSWEDEYMKEHSFDREGYDKVQRRISNGFRLFGKYYESLWS